MVTVVTGFMQNPIPMIQETLQCGVSDLFAGNVQLTGNVSISLLLSLLSRRVRRS